MQAMFVKVNVVEANDAVFHDEESKVLRDQRGASTGDAATYSFDEGQGIRQQ